MNKAGLLLNILKKNMEKSIVFALFYRHLFSLKNKWTNYHVVKKLKKIEGFSEKKINKLQREYLQKTLKYAYKNTAYYKSLFDNHNIDINNFEGLKKIPLLSKEIIRKKKSQLISKDYNSKYLIKKKTGGSTGEPLEFFCNSYVSNFDYGHHSYLCSLMGYKKGDIILACGGAKIPNSLIQQNIYWVKLKKGSPFGDYIFSVVHLTNNTTHKYVSALLDMRPSILRGYPSFFNTLANYIIVNNIKINFSIKGVILTSETCSTNQRINIEEAFNSLVYFEYGHKEVCLYCYTQDKTYTYKSSPIYGYLEILNEDGSETEIGQVGHIVVTGFNNLAMPFIRYKTGDLAQLKYRNAGVLHLNEIQGRQQSYAVSKAKEKVYLNPIIFGSLSNDVLKKVWKWQIVQNKIGVIEFYIIKRNTYTQQDELSIENVIKNAMDIEIIFKYVQQIAQVKNGKHLFLIQNTSY